MAKVIAFANHKGGVRKTTTAVCTADALSRDGYKVLLVDMDPQGHATALAYSMHSAPSSAVEQVLDGSITVAAAIIESPTVPGVHLIGATLNLINLENQLRQTPFSSTLLVRDMLERVSSMYDVIILDTGPALNFLTANALAAADAVFVPIESGSSLSMIGMKDLLRFIKDAQRVNPNLAFGGAILTMHDARKTLCQLTAASINETFGKVLSASLPVSEAMRQAQAIGKTILATDRESTAARKVVEIAREIATIVGLKPAKEAA